MRNTLCMYPGRDVDLVGLLNTVGIREFGQLLKESIRVLIRDGYKPKHLPPDEIIPYQGQEERFVLSVCIENKKDADISELLLHVKPRCFGAFCKTAMRFYIGRASTLKTMLDVASFDFAVDYKALRPQPAPFCIVPPEPAPAPIPIPATSLPPASAPVATVPVETPVTTDIPTPTTPVIPAPSVPQAPTDSTTSQEYSRNSGLVLDTGEDDDEDDILSLLEGMM